MFWKRNGFNKNIRIIIIIIMIFVLINFIFHYTDIYNNHYIVTTSSLNVLEMKTINFNPLMCVSHR